MKKTFALLVSGLLVSPLTVRIAAAAEPTRVLVITGGHDYHTNEFVKMFEDDRMIRARHVTHPQAHRWLQADRAAQYDVIVLYDMWPEITDQAKTNFLARLSDGKGLVALHHALASYQDWEEYLRVVGGRYHLEPWAQDGTTRPASTYKHDVVMPIHIAHPNHPVTRGLGDFEIHDETYGRLQVLPSVQILLTTVEPTSTREVAWAQQTHGTRTVCIQLGHDRLAFENPNYRRLLAQAIQWVGGP